MTAEYFRAADALRRADATVFAIDVTDAGTHDLEIGMKRTAADTGGMYYRANSAKNASLAVRRLAQVLAGHYVITLDTTHAPVGSVSIQLRGRKGHVVYPPLRTIERLNH